MSNLSIAQYIVESNEGEVVLRMYWFADADTLQNVRAVAIDQGRTGLADECQS